MKKVNSKIKRKIRNRKKLRDVNVNRLRVTVFKSSKNISAQIIDDKISKTLVSASSTEKDLKKIFPINDWNTLHLQIIFYGREYCTARGCDGTKCYLCRTLYPNRKKKFICKKP